MFGSASQGGEQADQQISADFDTYRYAGQPLIAFLWSADKYLHQFSWRVVQHWDVKGFAFFDESYEIYTRAAAA